MILKTYEISCDYCGCACYYLGSIKNAERQARSEGWIITRGKLHFDSKECFMKGKRQNGKEAEKSRRGRRIQ